jgi:two-component system, cell cycle sensor histidine kinase and response regulator CckA
MDKKKPITVLVVDDDPSILKLLKKLLSAHEYKPILAASGEEALELASEKATIDLLLTDIQMPGISGIALAKQFITLYPEVKVLFMSGFSLPETLYNISGIKMSFLQKPFGTKNLIQAVESCFEVMAS